MPPASKLNALQVVRAFAAILVAWSHCMFAARDSHVQVATDVIGHTRDLGACGVDLFFVLSGLVVSLSAVRTPSPEIFLLRRAARILPLFWLTAALFFVSRIGQGMQASQVAWLPFLVPSPVSPYEAPPVPNSWTLVYELFFYGCLFLGLKSRRSDPRVVCAAIVGAFVVAHGAGHVVLRRDFPVLTYYGCPIVFEFLYGMALGALMGRVRVRRDVALALIALGIGGFILSGIVDYGEIFNHFRDRQSLPIALARIGAWGVPSALVVAGAAAIDWSPRGALGRLFVYLGDACYSIYLMQWIPIFHIRTILTASSKAFGGDLGVLLFVAATVAFGCLIYRFVESPLTEAVTKRLVPRLRSEPLADAGIAPPRL